VKSITHEWGVVNENVTEVRSYVVICNPSPISAKLESLEYEIYMNDIKMAEGSSVETVDIPARGEAEVHLSTFIDNSKIPSWWASHVGNGEKTTTRIEGRAEVKIYGLTYEIPFSLQKEFETDFEEEADLTEPKEVEIADLRPLYKRVYVVVESVDTSWGEVSEETTQLIHVAEIYNPNDFDIPVTSFRYRITANEVILAEGEQPLELVVLEAGKTTTLRLYTYLDNTKLDDWWVSHINNGEKTYVKVEVYAAYRVQIPIIGVDITVEKEVLVKEFTVETDILGELTYP